MLTSVGKAGVGRGLGRSHGCVAQRPLGKHAVEGALGGGSRPEKHLGIQGTGSRWRARKRRE